MPVIFINWQLDIVNFYKNIKRYVIFFIYLFYCIYYNLLSFNQRKLVSQLSNRRSITWGKLTATGQMDTVRGKRCYISSSQKPGINLKTTKGQPKNKSPRKNLSSPESRPYADLYKGRGVPQNVPAWVKDNGMERSPFGASWAKDKKSRLPFPTKYPCNYQNISDPFNNRETIKKYCKGNRVVYIWTYMPTGVCLVGSSSNSVERVLSYFERKYLFLDKRRGVQFLSDYGFKNIQLTVIYFNYLKFTARDIKLVEAYYINELNSSLNSQKYVYLPAEPLESVLSFINISNRDTSVPIFVYGPDLIRVLYVFNSKTSFYNDFNVHWNTLEKYLDVANNKLYNYFTFSTKIFEGSDLDSLLSLNELIDLKTSVDPGIPNRGQKVKLKDFTQNIEYAFYSLSKAAAHILETTGSCDTATLRTHMKNNTIYKNRWKIEKI